MTALDFRPVQLWLVTLLFGALLTAAPQARAQTYGVGAGSAPFGNVASAASGDTQFTISANGGVTRDSGLGGRVSIGAAYATVTISCGNQGACNTKTVNVRVGSAGSPTGRAKAISAFNVASGTGTVSNVSGSNPLTFQLSPIGKNSSKTFKLGMTFQLKGDDSGILTTTSATTSYYVSVAKAPQTPDASGPTGSVTMTPFRSLSLAKISDLSFGRVVRPLSGSGTVTLNSNGTKSITAGVWLTTPTALRSMFTATGEGGKALSVSIDPSFTMTRTGGSDTIVVTTNNSVGSAVLSSIAGNSGTYNFFVGGSFPISSTTPSGAYTGAFNVMVAYN
jgi:hypothetical protein